MKFGSGMHLVDVKQAVLLSADTGHLEGVLHVASCILFCMGSSLH